MRIAERTTNAAACRGAGDEAVVSARRRARRRPGHGGTERSPYLHRFVVKEGSRYLLIRAEDVDWIEAAGNYARLHAGGETHLVRATMKMLDRRLDPRRFARIHRSTIVNLDRVAEIRPAEDWRGYAVVLRDGMRLRLSRTYRKRLLG